VETVSGDNTKDPIILSELYGCYKVFCEDVGSKALNRLNFGVELQSLGLQKFKSKKRGIQRDQMVCTGWHHIGTKPKLGGAKNKNRLLDFD